MILHHPFFISSHLAPAIKVGDVTISLTDRGETGREHRNRITFTFEGSLGTYVDDRIEVRYSTDTQECFRFLFSFLDAAAEASEHGDNADIFPPPIMEWCRENASEISSIRFDIETDNLIED